MEHQISYDEINEIVHVDKMKFSIEFFEFIQSPENNGKKCVIENINGESFTLKELKD